MTYNKLSVTLVWIESACDKAQKALTFACKADLAFNVHLRRERSSLFECSTKRKLIVEVTWIAFIRFKKPFEVG
ncbi:MAG: hypothetical protein ACTS80_00425 [Candidatus Hodgkinia cicadicola]